MIFLKKVIPGQQFTSSKIGQKRCSLFHLPEPPCVSNVSVVITGFTGFQPSAGCADAQVAEPLAGHGNSSPCPVCVSLLAQEGVADCRGACINPSPNSYRGLNKKYLDMQQLKNCFKTPRSPVARHVFSWLSQETEQNMWILQRSARCICQFIQQCCSCKPCRGDGAPEDRVTGVRHGKRPVKALLNVTQIMQ